MNFFTTGNSGLDLNLIAPVNARAGNFTSKGQTLVQSYSIAQNIFRLVDKGKIDFVLIGLATDVLFRDTEENLTADVFDKNLQALNDYIKLCRDNGVQPIAIIFPVAPSVRESYRKNFLEPLADVLAEFKKLYKLKVMNFFNAELPKDNFSDETNLNEEGAKKISVALTLQLFKHKIFSNDDFYNMRYDYFYNLSYMLTDKNFFHSLLGKMYSKTLEKLRRKNKIKVAFVTDHAATWCGDKLYNLFAKNPRFETTVFFCQNKAESTLEDARHDLEQLKSAGVNVVAAFDSDMAMPAQDIIFFLRPYPVFFPKRLQFENLTPQTLILYIPYAILTIPVGYYNILVFHVAWKIFFDTEFALRLLEQECDVGVPRGVVSGLPKLDFFFNDANKASFLWKMTRPDAKKIIWAPHWSMNFGVFYSTFQYNYKFMYEFAKSHPETSWVVKPHPRLMVAAVETEIFPSVAAYEDYLQAWNDLPNAQVFTGAYYQEIFATSDGMILDSLSFIAEYQYVNKPMIYLLNDESEEFSELGKKILDASYVIDGKNFEQIGDALQKIFIEGNDPLKSARQKVFDEELNYYRKNGMDASDFIYKTILEELREEKF